jgi:hypothetical protein
MGRALAAGAAIILLSACTGAENESARPGDVRAALSVLASDSLEGRRTGTAGSVRAASYVAEQFRDAGLIAAGDSGFFQRVPLASSGVLVGKFGMGWAAGHKQKWGGQLVTAPLGAA